MAMDEKKRQRISFFGAIGFHIIAALIIGLSGFLSYTSLQNSDIFEVTAVSDSSSGDSGDNGGEAGGSSSSSPEEQQPQQVANSEQQAFTPEQIGADAILEHSDTSPTKVTYDQLEQLQQAMPTDDASEQAPVVAPRPALATNTNSTGNGNGGENSNSTDKGNGNGNGNSTGNGNSDKGNGGNGNGGNGNGNGGDMGGEATNEVVNNPAQPPVPTHRAQPNYPSSARDAGIQGTVRIRFLIGKDGHVESASVAASSGNAALDQAAVDAAYRWRFSPAKDDQGRPVRCYASGPITFSLR